MSVRPNERGARRARGAAALVALAAIAASTSACFLVTSFDDLHPEGAGGASHGGGGAGPSGSSSGSSVGGGPSGPGGTGASTGSTSGSAGATSTSASSGTGGVGCTTDELCAPPPEAGWSPPSVFIETADASASCGAPRPLVSGNTSPAPASCSGCSCDPPLTCIALATPCSDGGCMNCPGGPTGITNAPCSMGGYSAPYTRITFQATSGGSCHPSGSPTPPSIAWGTHDVVCAPNGLGGTCGGGGTCVAKPATGKVCIYQDAPAGGCPAAYPEHHRIFQAADVACDACSCDSPVGTPNCAPSGGVQFFSDSGCGTSVGSIFSSGGCTNGITGAASETYVPTDPGSCSARSAANITPHDGVDVCCL